MNQNENMAKRTQEEYLSANQTNSNPSISHHMKISITNKQPINSPIHISLSNRD